MKRANPGKLRTKSDQVMTDLVNSLAKIVGYSILSYVVIVVLYSWIENETFFNAAWWTSVTAYTVGYGDMYPSSAPGKVLGIATMSIFWLFLQLLQVNIIVRYLRDEHEYTDAEQKENRSTLGRIIQLLRCILRNQRKAMANQQQIMDDLAAIKQQLGIEASPHHNTSA